MLTNTDDNNINNSSNSKIAMITLTRAPQGDASEVVCMRAERPGGQRHPEAPIIATVSF